MVKQLLKIYRYTIVALVGIAAVLALEGCTSGEGEFADVVYVADEGDDKLPMASEVGANTAGCYFESRAPREQERATWTMNYNRYSSYPHTAEIRIVNDSLRLTILGEKKPHNEPVSIIFTIPNLPIDSLPGLQSLSGQSFTTRSALRASISPERGLWVTHGNRIVVKEASIQFTRCRRIYQDEINLKGVSVSGRFDITGTAADTINVAATGGRFDLLFKSRDGNGVFFQ